MAIKQGDKKYSAVYVSWGTFLNAINQLSQALPHQIDRSVFPGMAWAIQSQLITGFRFLGLIDEQGKPTAALAGLTSDPESARKQRLAGILREKYEELYKLDLVKASPLQIRQTMSHAYGVNGATLERAIRFFVSAAEYCAMPISPLLAGAKPNGVPKKRRAIRVKPIVDESSAEIPETMGPGTSRTVKLVSGGSLTLSASLDLFALNSSDRHFVFGLIDKLEEYQRTSDRTEPPVSNTAYRPNNSSHQNIKKSNGHQDIATFLNEQKPGVRQLLHGLYSLGEETKAEDIALATGLSANAFGGLLGALSKTAKKISVPLEALYTSSVKFDGPRRERWYAPGKLLQEHGGKAFGSK